MGLFGKKHDANVLQKSPPPAHDQVGSRQNAAPLGGGGAGVREQELRGQQGHAGETGYQQGEPGWEQRELGSRGGQSGYGHETSGQGHQGAGQLQYDQQAGTQQSRSGGGILGHKQHGGGGLKHAEGRAEEDVGELIGSRALQAKGMEKEQEANRFRQQASELSEAERLEKEAFEARQRAVQHGAHNANAQLGAGNDFGRV
ncbi:hypothetical protein PUNSTDRAFT_44880 [Punctularia strigosozonata HHB-11173 SS5]|uniref:uncharacterized protein n=1 Tax=Punctularia strigosozonata (strain HHB-11173) TaxID=741275 RepID=UPI0004416E2B|nr:uncharacterized protein PUNSTDRAFT_44880 [Punctularia strigosozonata HHB-11173 SS5]EIN08356.1 hypothetical protein PUNSTDRAFT_44880 [Punctularia strigosozonata HHB-11173 SS5]